MPRKAKTEEKPKEKSKEKPKEKSAENVPEDPPINTTNVNTDDEESELDTESNVDDTEYEDNSEDIDDDVDDEQIVETAFEHDQKDSNSAFMMTSSKRKNGLNNIVSSIDKEDEYIDDNEDNCNEFVAADPIIDTYVDPAERVTFPILTKYEYVRLLSTRTAQLASGAKMMIKNGENMDPRDIAQYELETKQMPINVIRPLPNGKKELWKISELTLKKSYIKSTDK